MKYVSKTEMHQIAGADDTDAYNSGIYASIGSLSTALGTAIAGPIGAAVGAGVGAVASHLIANHKEEVAHALGQAAITVASNYGQGHKDGMFTGMPMAFQK